MNEIKINSLLKHKPFELDEVKKKKLFSEDTTLNPSSPYSASKADAEYGEFGL